MGVFTKYELRVRNVLWTIERSAFRQNRESLWHVTRDDQEPSVVTGRDAAAVLKTLEETGVAKENGLPVRLYDWNERG